MRDLVPLLTERTRAMHAFLRDQATLGVEPWATHWRTGHGDAWGNDADYTERHTDHWAKALLDVAGQGSRIQSFGSFTKTPLP
ncbi:MULTISPECIES: hypothetical protein [Micromonospora]|uniref:hypothetical protein n=1 Tax=Micromonospora TaxID=1873 RepID=UPI001FFB15E0|nr:MULTISPECIES: hypothetical protein [Micromonospora]